jgi:acyl carrier protein
MTKNDFYKLFAERLNISNAELNENTELDSFIEWDSYGVLDIMVMTDEVFQVSLDAKDFRAMKTIGDLMSKLGASNFE